MTTLINAYETYRDELVAAGLLIDSGVPGLFGRNSTFESIVTGLNALVDDAAKPDKPEHFSFPPLLSRRNYELTDHLRSFPDLMGAVHSFRGGDVEHRALVSRCEDGEDWAADLTSTNLMLCPAACYPLYPMLQGHGLPSGGRCFDVVGYCFRHEPSVDPARMQLFRMHEIVFVGEPDDALAFRNRWIDRSLDMLGGLGLNVRAEVANDPFFGRAGKMLKANQVEAHLKYEIVTPICSDQDQTAIASCNSHVDHLTVPFALRLADGGVAHSACVGFGLERVTLALLKRHGLDVHAWPDSARTALRL
jgi:seryl-tRNA synthetase